MATLLIALLTAFLTVVALWQIAPSDDPLAKRPAGTDSKPAGSATDSSPFTTRFGATVLAGLGGLVVAEVTKTLGSSTPGADTKWYYIVCFIFFFFVLLLFLNFLRAVAEALRSRVAVIYYPLTRVGRPGPRSIGLKFFDWLSYWASRLIRWVFSFRVPLLTFFDTFINLIQGKNQTTTQAFTDAIIEQQRNVIRVADVIRKKLNSLIESYLWERLEEEKRAAEMDKEKRPGQVRVSVSVMSTDQSNVYYISRSAGSALLPFPKISLAWVSVFTGKIRWYESNYQKQNIILFDNTNNTIPDAPKELLLDNYYQYRDGDYEAFVVLPLPHPQRAFGSRYVKGAIHISFSSKGEFEKIWSRPTVAPPTAAPGAEVPPAAASAPAAPTVPPSGAPALAPPAPVAHSEASAREPLPMQYPEIDHMLDDWCPDPAIRTALNDAVAVLGELLHGFNEVIYNNYIQPNQGD
jgi:hypothetical protein